MFYPLFLRAGGIIFEGTSISTHTKGYINRNRETFVLAVVVTWSEKHKSYPFGLHCLLSKLATVAAVWITMNIKSKQLKSSPNNSISYTQSITLIYVSLVLSY